MQPPPPPVAMGMRHDVFVQRARAVPQASLQFASTRIGIPMLTEKQVYGTQWDQFKWTSDVTLLRQVAFSYLP